MNQEHMPLVTAVIPVYNHEKYVVESIRSILDQSYPNIELIVINDGSKDRSHELILALLDECKQRFSRFEYINRSNMGLTATLNQALGMAKGKYFSILASDDIALPDKFALLVDALESADGTCAAAFGNAEFIDNDDHRIRLSEDGLISHTKTAATYDNYLDFRTGGGRVVDYRGTEFGHFRSLLAHNYLPAMSCVVKTDLIRKVGAWTEGNASEDWELWRKLSKHYRFLYLDISVALYRWHDSNSVKISSPKLKLCSLSLLTLERQYCAQHGLLSCWKRAYPSLWLPVLMDKRITWGEKLSEFQLSELLPVSFYVAKRAVQKILKIVRNEK